MKYLILFIFLFSQISLYSQFYIGTLSEDYQLQVKKIDKPFAKARNAPPSFSQLEGFPLRFPSDPNTPNLRNVTLEDINNDGIQELLFCANNIMYAYSGSTSLWEKAMVGTGIYPPSVADIDGDGDMEIVQLTGGNGKKGSIYAVDHLGNNLAGFPKNYDDNWLITSVALSDLDQDGQMEIIFCERNPPNGYIHILNNKGEKWSDSWPQRIPGTPSLTPSIGDIDQDGEKDIVVASTTVLYAFNLAGQLKDGWPVEDIDTKFAFQSTILVDLDGDKDLEIIGAAHGNLPQFYVLHHDGTAYNSWPYFVPERTWSFTTPTVIEENGDYQILMSRPTPITPINPDKIYKWDAEGNPAAGFPYEDELGTNGVITVANIDEDEAMEIVFATNTFTEDGNGFIHAVNLDGSGTVEGFPILVKGYTLLNGAAIGDINGDGLMDLTALGYTPNFDAAPDSVYINSFNLGTNYHPDKILWTTYKGSNSRDGNLDKNIVSALSPLQVEDLSTEILPNPLYEEGTVLMQVNQKKALIGRLVSANGQYSQTLFSDTFQKGNYSFNLSGLEAGLYFLVISGEKNRLITKKIIVLNR